MSKKTKTPAVDSAPANEQQPVESGQPAFVKELLEKGVVVLSGRSREELAEMLDNIPADCSYYAGCITKSYDTGLYRLQVNRKEE